MAGDAAGIEQGGPRPQLQPPAGTSVHACAVAPAPACRHSLLRHPVPPHSGLAPLVIPNATKERAHHRTHRPSVRHVPRALTTRSDATCSSTACWRLWASWLAASWPATRALRKAAASAARPAFCKAACEGGGRGAGPIPGLTNTPKRPDSQTNHVRSGHACVLCVCVAVPFT